MRPDLSPRMLGLFPDARRTLELAARHGFGGVELLIRDLHERGDDVSELGRLKADLGLQGGSWPLPVDWRGDGDRFRDGLARLPSFARVAADLGLDRTGTWVLPEILDPDLLGRDRIEEAAFAWHVERLDAIAAILGDFGHRLGLEAIGVSSFRSGRGARFIDRLVSLEPLVRALRDRGRAVGLTVDAFHLYAAGESIDVPLSFGPDTIVSVHLSEVLEGSPTEPEHLRDDHRTLPVPGGIIPNAALLEGLTRIGYSGPVFAEPKPGAQPSGTVPGDAIAEDAIIRDASQALRAIWPANLS